MFTQLRIYDKSTGQFAKLLDMSASGASAITSIASGQGIAVSVKSGAATIINTAQNQVGPPGARGVPGEQRDRGLTGDQGERGEKGETGDKGEKRR